MTSPRTTAALLVLLLTGCAKTVDFYAEHPEARSQKLAECRSSAPNPFDARECKNALLAEQIARPTEAAPSTNQLAKSSLSRVQRQSERPSTEVSGQAPRAELRNVTGSALSRDLAGEHQLNAVSSARVQELLVQFASELNQGNLQSAGATLRLQGVTPTELLNFANAGGGYTSVKQESFDHVSASPTRPARIIARVTLKTAKNARPEFGTAGTTSCVRFTFEISAASNPAGFTGSVRDLDHSYCLP